MSPRLHSPSISSSASSSSSRLEHDELRHSDAINNSSYVRGHRSSLDNPHHSRQQSCCAANSSSSSLEAVLPLSHPASSYSHAGTPAPGSSPWSLDSLAHLARRAARQLASSTSSTADNGGYLPVFTGKQRLSLDRSLECQDGSDPLLDKYEKCSCKQRQRSQSHHNQQHYHPPASLRSTCCLSPSSGSVTPVPGGHPSRRYTLLISLLRVAVLVLAVLGVATVVGFATGLVQRTPMYTEKALQDAGWARRPIALSRHSPNSGHTAQQSFSQDPYTGVTLHDFSPQKPLHALTEYPASSSSSSISTQTRAHPPNVPISSDDLHLLILCPLRNSAPDLPHLFKLLDGLAHPSVNTSLGFLVGDEDDDTGDVLHRLVQERANRDEDQRYRHITMLHKDFNLQVPSGANRHSYPVQLQRRSVMARARTYLITATLEPTVDWVLWVDSDISEVSPTLFQDLLLYGKAGIVEPNRQYMNKEANQKAKTQVQNNLNEAEWNDVIIPNAMKRLPDGNLLGFDMNNWAETPESLKLKADMKPDHLLIEGNIWQHMHRVHLADEYVPYTVAETSTTSTSDEEIVKHPNQPEIFSSDPRYINSLPETDQRLNVSSPAYIGRLQPLDGIGGVAALVRAEVHRMGAIFPSWIFENQLETEAFGVLAKRLGARVVGLPNLFVLHGKPFDNQSLKAITDLCSLSLLHYNSIMRQRRCQD